MILPNFPINCMKLRKFWAVGGTCAGPPLGSAIATGVCWEDSCFCICSVSVLGKRYIYISLLITCTSCTLLHILIISTQKLQLLLLAWADLGFPRGGGVNSPGGRQHTILPNVPKNCMKLKEFGPPGGCMSKILLCRSATD